MTDDRKASESINWPAVSQVFHNLPVIWGFLMVWSEMKEQFTPDGLINLYRVCWDIAWLLNYNKMKMAVLVSVGDVYTRIRRFNDALECFNKELEIAKRTGNKSLQGTVYRSIGNVHAQLGNNKDALEYYEKALQIFRQTGDMEEEGNTLDNIGNVHLLREEYEEAMKLYKNALKMQRQTGALTGEETTLNNIGNVHLSRGEYEEAMKYYKNALKIERQTGYLPGEGTTLGNIGIVHQSRGEYEDALKYLKDALKIHRQTGDLAGEGNTLNHIGTVHLKRAEYEEALKYYNDALKIQRKTGDLVGERATLINIGNVHKSRGEYEEAMKYYKDSLKICRQTGALTGEGNILNNIGNVHHTREEYEKAMEYYKDALKIQRGIGDLPGEGITLGNIGNVHQSRGEYEDALKYYKNDLKICRQTGELAGEGATLNNIGIVHKSRGEYKAAIKYYKDALKIFKQTGDLKEEAMTASNVGTLSLYAGDIIEAENQLKKGILCFEKIYSMLGKQCPSKVTIVDTYVNTYRILTFVLFLLGKCQEALLTSESGRSQALRDHLLEKYQITSEHAIASARVKYVDLLTSSRNSNFVTYYDSSFSVLMTFVMSVSQEVAGHYLKQSDLVQLLHKEQEMEVQTVLSFSSVKKLIIYADEYLHRNRDNTFEDRSLGHVEQEVSLYKQTRGDTIVPLEKIMELLPGIRDSTEQSQAEQSGKSAPSKHDDENSTPSGINVSGNENGYKTDSNTNWEDTSCEDLLKDFYKSLIAPIENELDQREIVIIPDGPLFFVPFAALKDSRGRYLSEAKRIRIGPSLTTLYILKEYPVEKQSTKGALIIGDPLVENVMWNAEFEEKPFPDLPNACNEALKVASLFRERPLIRSAANKEAVMSRLREGVAVIHFATHGSGETGELLLAPGPRDDHTVPTEADYMLTVKEIISCNINAQLVVLSCCYSGSGEVRAEGVMSLARAFLVAGARSVLATLWQVSDQGTLCFMESFYGHLTSGKSACTSLQEAMREMRAHPEYNHWSYWAPFFIIGHDVTLFGGSDVTG